MTTYYISASAYHTIYTWEAVTAKTEAAAKRACSKRFKDGFRDIVLVVAIDRGDGGKHIIAKKPLLSRNWTTV